MATGYTSPVMEGKVTDLKDYAADCARAFGAFIHMRDDGNNAVLRYPEHHTFDSDSYNRAFIELESWENLNEEGRYAMWSNYYRRSVQVNLEFKAKANLHESRYTAMLAQIVPLDVPSELQAFKDFMVSQLEDSINFDCNHRYMVPADFFEWCDDHDEYLRRSLRNAQKRMIESIEKHNKTVDYINLMAETFGFEIAHD